MSNNLKQLRKQAEELFGQKKYDAILELLNDSILVKYNDAELYVWRARANERNEMYDSGFVLAQKAIELNPGYWMGYFVRGNIWGSKKEYDKAIEDYNTASKLNPENADIYINRGYVWDDKKEYDKAIEDYNKAIQLSPEDEVAYNNRGYVWHDKKEYNKAIEDYSKAIELKPEYAAPCYNLALIEKDTGNIKAAIEHFQRSKELGHRIEDAEYWINELREREQLNVPLEDEINKGLQRIKNIVSAIRHKSLLEADIEQVVHYSKLVVADIITGDRQSKLHYSNVIYMNDPLEGKTFIDYLNDTKLKDWFERASYKNESTIFLGSFLPVNTKDEDGNAEDMLLMWRTYGKGEDEKDAAGCNFVIDRRFFETEQTRDGTAVPESFDDIKAAIERGDVFNDNNRNSLLKIQYIRGNEILHDKDKVIRKLINYLKEEIKILTKKNAEKTIDPKTRDYTDSRIFDALQELCHLFKAADYSFEKEVRIIRSEHRNSSNIEYYKTADGAEPKPPKKFYVRSSKRVLPYIRKIYLGPKVTNTSHWSLHFDYSIRKEERELIELEYLQKKDIAKITEAEKKRLDSLNETYRGILNGSEEKINASQVEIIPSSCHFI